MKKLKWIILAVVVLIVVVIGIVILNLNGIVRGTVESQASSSLDLKTTLQAAHVSIFGQSLSLDDLAIASPPGYSAPQILAFSKAGVSVSIGDLRGDPVHIKTVTIESPAVTIEANGSKLNFQALMNRPSSTPTAPKSGEATQPMKVIIDELTVTNPKVVLMPGKELAAIGLKDFSLTLPSITLKNIGTGDGANNGVAIKDVVVQLLTKIASSAADSDQLPPQLRDLLHLNVQQVAQQFGKQLQDQLGKNLGDTLKNNDAGKAIQNGLGDLLGKDKKKKDAK